MRRWLVSAGAACAVLTAAGAARAQVVTRPRLLADVGSTPLSSEPSALVRLGSRVVFSAQTRSEGRELWASDGTAAGTRLLRDVKPGTGSGMPYGTIFATSPVLPTKVVTAVGEIALFAADDGVNGMELWRTDGTPEGTVLVKDLRPGSTGSSPQAGFEHDGVLYFSADDGVSGRELWRSDGTETGTVRVYNFADDDTGQGPVGSTPQVLGFTGAGGMFVRATGVMYLNPGLTTATTLLPGNVSNNEFAIVNDRLVFTYFSTVRNDEELWVSDGTEAGTALLKDIAPGVSVSSWPSAFFVARGIGPGGADVLYFQAAGPGIGYELYKSDGTEAGTVLVKDLVPGAGGSSPWGFAQAGRWVLMWASVGGGVQMVATDGTETNTSIAAYMTYGGMNVNAYLGVPTVVREGSATYFVGRPNPGGIGDVYRVDDPAADEPVGTPVRVTSLTTGSVGSLAIMPGLGVGGSAGLIMGGGSALGVELLVERGAGTEVLADLREGTSGSDPGWLTAVGRRLVFTARAPVLYELLGADVDGDGTFERIAPSSAINIQEPSSGSTGTPAVAVGPAGPVAVFQSSDASSGAEPWRTDGSTAGTSLLADVTPGGTGSQPTMFTAVGGRVVFLRGSSGTEIWQSDGTSAGTSLLLRTASSLPSPVLPIAGGFLWPGTPVGGTSGLNRTLVPSGVTNRIATAGSYVWPGVSSGPVVFYRGLASGTGEELWKTDGTDAGTGPVADLNPGAASSQVQNLTPTGDGAVYFTAITPGIGREPCFSDGTAAGTVVLGDLTTGPGSSTVSAAAALVGEDGVRRGFFVINGQLWVSRGTAATTEVLSDLRPGTADNYQQLTAIGGKLYFAADDGVAGQELWVSDGTPAGTRRLTDLCPGGCASFPLTGTRASITRVVNRLAFVADDGRLGSEVWTIDLCPADFNNDGVVSVQDLFEFLAAYFTGSDRADVNGAGGVSVQDVFDFLAAWFGGC